MTTDSPLAQRAQAMRRFNRFYTKQIGVLTHNLLHSPFTLAEARVIYEMAHHDRPTATALGNELGLDPGQLSRILRDLNRQGIVSKKPSPTDKRQSLLSLTAKGQKAFAQLNSRSQGEIETMLGQLSEGDQQQLMSAMERIEGLLNPTPTPKAAYLLRAPQPGDLGQVIALHGRLYAHEYGWNEEFEGLVAEIVAKFIHDYDPKWERFWIAEMDGQVVGSVCIVKKSATVAKLRLLIVDPKARGLGMGNRLVEECIRFARQAGYKKMTLWTNSILTAARHIYTKAGFQLTVKEQHHSYGHDLIGETWDLDL